MAEQHDRGSVQAEEGGRADRRSARPPFRIPGLGALGARRALELLTLAALVAYPLMAGGVFEVDRMGRYLLYAVFAISVDLIWGYGGMFTFGHAAFFGGGGYLVGILTTRDLGPLPIGLWPALLVSIVVAGAFAWLLATFVFRGRGALRGVEFAVVTLAVAVVGQRLANAGGEISGGQNGILMSESLRIGDLRFQTGYEFYWFAAAVLVASYLLVRAFLASRSGLVLRGVRENEERVGLLGYSVPAIKRRAFVLSGALAAMAGAIFHVHDGIVSPGAVGVSASTLVLLWVVLGGRGTLLGPVIGAIALPYMTSTLSGAFLDTWLVLVGVILVLVITLLPAGLFGFLDRGRRS